MAVLLPSVATACKGMLRATNASSFFFSPVFKEVKTRGRYAGVRARLGGDGDINLNGAAVIAEDFYSVLGLTSDATPDEIKKAYYSCMKACHPDLSGNHPESTDFCMFINEIYEVPV
jgi:DnaJ-domain-containing protein 1